MYKEFKVGDKIVSRCAIYCEITGNKICNGGREFTVMNDIDGYLTIGERLLFGTVGGRKVDRFQFFSLIEEPKKMTVAEVNKELGYTVEIVEG